MKKGCAYSPNHSWEEGEGGGNGCWCVASKPEKAAGMAAGDLPPRHQCGAWLMQPGRPSLDIEKGGMSCALGENFSGCVLIPEKPSSPPTIQAR